LQLSRLLEDEDETRRPRNAIVLNQKENKAWLNDIRRAKGSIRLRSTSTVPDPSTKCLAR